MNNSALAWDYTHPQKKKESEQSQTHSSNNDSLFNRVFGHHYSDFSRAGSPIQASLPQQPQQQQPQQSNKNKFVNSELTKSSLPLNINNSKKLSRHNRNSSAENINTNILAVHPIVTHSTSTTLTKKTTAATTSPIPMQRRRSFEEGNSLRTVKPKATPTPTSSVSARVTSPIPTARNTTALSNNNKSSSKPINTTVAAAEVQFPRGGRKIGTTLDSNINSHGSTSLLRSPSFDRATNNGKEDQPPKKRHLFHRFGRRKNHPTTSTANSSNSSVGSTSSNTSNSLLNNNLTPRKKSSDIDRRQLLLLEPTTASDIQKSYYQQQMKEERKRLANGNSKKFRDNKDPMLQLRLDQNFDKMDGIVNPDYYRGNAASTTSAAPSVTSTLVNSIQTNNQMDLNGYDFESWAAPDSWGVQPVSIISGVTNNYSMVDDETTEFEDYSIDVPENRPKKNANIKIYRPDKTYNTLHVPLDSTTLNILKKLASKFFMAEITKFNLVLKQNNIERALGLTERPLQIQKHLQEQMGYMDQDTIDDSSYLVRFQMVPNIAQPFQDFDEHVEHVNLESRSLATIPICLYKHAQNFLSVNISRNLLIELPLDFVQICTRLKELRLADIEYTALPPSVQHISSLEHLNISGNRLRDLDHANIDKIKGLRILKAINNRLESIPDSFATSFHSLTTLSISNNSFTKFPLVICEIYSLTDLDISFNKIQLFPDEIGQLTNLTELLAMANRITGSLPSAFTNLKKLRKLDVRQNLITDLDVVSHLIKLEELLVDYNSTSIVNFEIKSLKQLIMYKNHLTQFNLTSAEPEAGMCLTILNLSCCKLSSLPEDLFNNAQGLEYLVLDGNTLNSLPSSIGALKRLLKLSIQNNNIDSLPSEIGKLVELRTLDAQKNNLKALPKEIWLCGSLQTLNCSSNLLESFPEPLSSMAVTTPSTPLSSANTVTDLSVLDMCEDDSMSILPNTLNAGQGIIKRLDRLLDYNSAIQQQKVSSGNISACVSPITPSIVTSIQQQNDMPSISAPSPATSAPPPNFNPPSFFASPRNHPPPLSLSLRYLLLGDNQLNDDIWSPLSLFLELRTLNLSFNDLYEVPPDGLCHQHLYELHLSGNQLTSLPADDIEKLQYLRVLAVNGNKLQTLPAEIGKLRKLLVLDVGNNVLKYNIANWPYDWNWNWNLGLKYLNLSGNKRLEIQKSHPDPSNPKDKDLSDFGALTKLRMLGLMDITILGVSIPEEFHDRRVRTSPSEVNSMSYGVADWLGGSDHLSTWDLVMPKFRSKDDECIFALFDGPNHPKTGCKLTKQLNDMLIGKFVKELASIKSEDTVVSAIRRAFLSMEQNLGTSVLVDKDSGASAAVCYIAGTKLYVANVGDTLAVISRNNGQAYEITQKHISLNPSEVSRIRAAGGYVSDSGKLNNELIVSRSFGYFHLIPVVNCNPFVSVIDLAENDEFVIMASRGLWDRMTYQTAVDIARTEKDDLMAAAQKLRDFAITYGAKDNLMVMVIGVGDIFDKRDKRFRNRGNNAGRAADAGAEDGLLVKSKRRGKEEMPGDSTLARLGREVAPPMSQLALVFTDIKSSTQFWETQPENMRSSIKLHDAIMRRTLRSAGGYEVKTEGDAFMVCFKNITAALLWCFTVQLQLLEADWPAGILDTDEGREIEKDDVIIYRGLSVRMGIHWGTPVFERNPITQRMDYFGPVVNKASRICNAADGGQICVSSDVIAALRNFPSMFDEVAEATQQVDESFSGPFPVSRDLVQLKLLGFHVVELGERRLKGLETPENLSLVYSKQLLSRIEIDKSEMMGPPAVTSGNGTPISIKPESVDASPATTLGSAGIDSASLINTSLTSAPVDYLTARLLPSKPAVVTKRTTRSVDPNLVCAISNLAIRLERLTSGNILSQAQEYTISEDGSNIAATPSGLGLMLDRHIREDASDEELTIMMENCVARVENATSSLYLHKMGRFAGVLEKLGDAIEVDPMHIFKALQMYAESSLM